MACGMCHVVYGMWHVACRIWHVACGTYTQHNFKSAENNSRTVKTHLSMRGCAPLHKWWGNDGRREEVREI